MSDAWKNIKHFDPKEFDSPDAPGSGININIELIHLLDALRDRCGFPLIVTSGFRTEEHNKTVAGKDSSAHIRGNAVDLSAAGSYERYKIIKHAMELGFCRIGIGGNFIHIDLDLDLPQNVVWHYGNSR